MHNLTAVVIIYIDKLAANDDQDGIYQKFDKKWTKILYHLHHIENFCTTALTFRKCKMYCKMLQIILVPDFCPQKTGKNLLDFLSISS